MNLVLEGETKKSCSSFVHQMFAYLPRILHGIFLSFLPAWMMVMMWFVAQFIHHMHAQAKILVFSLCWWNDKRVFVLLFLHSFPEFSYYIFPSFWSFDCDHHVVCYSVKLWYWNEEYLIKAVSLNQKSGLHDEKERKAVAGKLLLVSSYLLLHFYPVIFV